MKLAYINIYVLIYVKIEFNLIYYILKDNI